MLLGGALGGALGGWVSAGIARAHLGIVDRAVGAVARAALAAALCWFVLAVIVAFGPADWTGPITRTEVANPARVPVVDGIERAVRSAAPQDVAALVPATDARPPDRTTVAAVDRAVGSGVFKVHASGCQDDVEGTAFAVSDGSGGEWAVTNAHVARGASGITLLTAHGSVPAHTVTFDSGSDLAVLSADGLDEPTLPLGDDAANGTPAVIVGYPHDGPRSAVPAVIEQRLPTADPGLSDGLVLHLAYRLDADVEHGNSGSRLLTTSGRVVGVVNATAGSRTGQGYAITVSELHDVLGRAAGSTRVSTGTCSG